MTLLRPRIVHQGRGGYIELDGERIPIEHVEGGRFAIHLPRDQHPRRDQHRAALERLVEAEPETWTIEERGRGGRS
jgi:hypothetical protein